MRKKKKVVLFNSRDWKRLQEHKPAEAQFCRAVALRRAAHAKEDRRRQVPAKAQSPPKFISLCIDGGTHRRYSQAQIPDLVANAIPRSRHSAQSSGSALSRALRLPQNYNLYLLVAMHPVCPNPPLFNRTVVFIHAQSADKLPVATPHAAPLSPCRIPSTRQRHTGGHRIL